jgi:hypothetical protein
MRGFGNGFVGGRFEIKHYCTVLNIPTNRFYGNMRTNMSKRTIGSPKVSKRSDMVSLNTPVIKGTFNQDMKELKKKANSSVNSPNERGSHSVSGSTPGPESEDVLKNVHDVGIAPNADSEHPTELNIAKDIDTAEKKSRD